MAGTKVGGLKARETNYQNHGKDFYREMGRKGGRVRSPFKGFGSNHQRAVDAGCKGGKISKRGKHYDN